MGGDFSDAMAHIAQGVIDHAARDGLTGVKRAVFIDRGRHAPGEHCPSAEPEDPHDYWCQRPDDECSCKPDSSGDVPKENPTDNADDAAIAGLSRQQVRSDLHGASAKTQDTVPASVGRDGDV